jgi:hypothetical protein
MFAIKLFFSHRHFLVRISRKHRSAAKPGVARHLIRNIFVGEKSGSYEVVRRLSVGSRQSAVGRWLVDGNDPLVGGLVPGASPLGVKASEQFCC